MTVFTKAYVDVRGQLNKLYSPLGYRVVNSTVTVFGMEFDLVRNEEVPKMYTTEADVLKCVISYETDSRLRVRIFNPDDPDRYVVRF